MADPAGSAATIVTEEPRQTPVPSRTPKLGVVIGSGSIKCASALGFLRVLARERIPVDLVVGCSAGGICASALALGWDLDALEKKCSETWGGVFARFDYRSVLQGLLPRLFRARGPIGLLDERRMKAVLESMYGETVFADARIPLYIVATDLNTGDSVILSEGRLLDAVRASIAIPVLLRPVAIDGRLLFDGGASDPLPVSVAIREGCDIILAMGFENPLHEKVGSLMSLVSQTTSITINNLLRFSYSFYSAAHHAEIVPIIPTFDRDIQLRDSSLLPYIIERGEEAASRQLPFLRRLLGPGGGPCGPPNPQAAIPDGS
jgi:NTE family protein